jgi:AraC family transcriptional regulator of adaptative response / DNA-3-methyladenine glycosylase II
MGGLTLRLDYQPPFDWENMLAYFRARAIAGVEHVTDGTYRRTVTVDGDPGVLELSAGSPNHLVLRAHLPQRAHLRQWHGLIDQLQPARRIFNLDAGVSAASAHLQGDAVIGSLLLARPGLRPPGAWDPFETGVRAIIGQQVSVTGANTLTARVVKRHGSPVPGLGHLGLTHVFPTAASLADADLSGLGLTTARQRSVCAFARAVTTGTLDVDSGSSLDHMVASITAIPGLGPWTAHYLALRMGHPDAFPATDLGIRRALARAIGRSITGAEAGALAERWRPQRATAATHLWLARPT